MDEYVEDRSDEGPIKGEIQICIEQIEKTFESQSQLIEKLLQ